MILIFINCLHPKYQHGFKRLEILCKAEYQETWQLHVSVGMYVCMTFVLLFSVIAPVSFPVPDVNDPLGLLCLPKLMLAALIVFTIKAKQNTRMWTSISADKCPQSGCWGRSGPSAQNGAATWEELMVSSSPATAPRVLLKCNYMMLTE